MTTYQSMMLSVCFGVSMGWLLSGLVLIVKEFISSIKRKIKAKHSPSNEESTETQEK